MYGKTNEGVSGLLSNAKSLDDIARKMRYCKLCDLCSDATRMYGRGNPQASYFFIVSEKDPTADDENYFGLTTGKFFITTLKAVGIDLHDVWVTSATVCQPNKRDDDIQEKHINACKPHVISEIHLVRPKIVIALGTKAIKAAFAYVGNKPSVEKDEGTVLDTIITGDLGRYHLPVMITETPMLLMRFPDESKGGSWDRFSEAILHAKKIVDELARVEAKYASK